MHATGRSAILSGLSLSLQSDDVFALEWFLQIPAPESTPGGQRARSVLISRDSIPIRPHVVEADSRRVLVTQCRSNEEDLCLPIPSASEAPS